MSFKFCNRIRRIFAVALIMAFALSFNVLAASAAELEERAEQVYDVSAASQASEDFYKSGIRYWDDLNSYPIGGMNCTAGSKYTVIVNFRGLNNNFDTSQKSKLRINAIGSYDIFNKNIKVDGVSYSYTFTAEDTGIHNIYVDTLLQDDFAYAVSIYKN